jgi:hypothetical protein
MEAKITDAFYNALKLKYQAEYQEANATLLVYFSNPVGIGEHPQHLEEMDKQMVKMVDAQDKLDLLTRKFENVRD